MIARDASPIAHTPPRKRIDIGQAIEPNPFPTTVDGPQNAEHDRIMDLVRQTATGTNPPTQAMIQRGPQAIVEADHLAQHD